MIRLRRSKSRWMNRKIKLLAYILIKVNFSSPAVVTLEQQIDLINSSSHSARSAMIYSASGESAGFIRRADDRQTTEALDTCRNASRDICVRADKITRALQMIRRLMLFSRARLPGDSLGIFSENLWSKRKESSESIKLSNLCSRQKVALVCLIEIVILRMNFEGTSL